MPLPLCSRGRPQLCLVPLSACCKQVPTCTLWNLDLIIQGEGKGYLGGRRYIRSTFKVGHQMKHASGAVVNGHAFVYLCIPNTWMMPDLLYTLGKDLWSKWATLDFCSLPWCLVSASHLAFGIFHLKTDSRLTSQHLGSDIHFFVCHSGSRMGFPGGAVVKNLPAITGNAKVVGLVPELGRSPGVRNSDSFQYSCLENAMDRGAWWVTVHEVTKSQTQLSGWVHNTQWFTNTCFQGFFFVFLMLCIFLGK